MVCPAQAPVLLPIKTAGKEYFLGNIARAGARPNQWIEQQISDMMAKIGRTPEANFSVLRALENELDLDEARVRITNEISDQLRANGDLSQGKLGSLVSKELSSYAEKKQDILFNDLRAIKAIAEKSSQKFRKVEKGTKVSDFMAQALLKQFGNDPKKAADEAKKLGYEFSILIKTYLKDLLHKIKKIIFLIFLKKKNL